MPFLASEPHKKFHKMMNSLGTDGLIFPLIPNKYMSFHARHLYKPGCQPLKWDPAIQQNKHSQSKQNRNYQQEKSYIVRLPQSSILLTNKIHSFMSDPLKISSTDIHKEKSLTLSKYVEF